MEYQIETDKINELNKLILDLKKQLEEKKKAAYTEANRKATQKYRTEHREKFNEYQRNYHKYRMETDPDYRIRFNERMKRNRHKRKEKLNNI